MPLAFDTRIKASFNNCYIHIVDESGYFADPMTTGLDWFLPKSNHFLMNQLYISTAFHQNPQSPQTDRHRQSGSQNNNPRCYPEGGWLYLEWTTDLLPQYGTLCTSCSYWKIRNGIKLKSRVFALFDESVSIFIFFQYSGAWTACDWLVFVSKSSSLLGIIINNRWW